MPAHTGRSDAIGDGADATYAVDVQALAHRIAAIAKTLEDRSALETQLSLALSEVVQLRDVRAEVLNLRLVLAANKERMTLDQAALQTSEATIRDLSKSLAVLVDERDEEAEKRKSVTKKYRRAASIAEQLKRDLASLEQRLALAQGELTKVKGSPLFRLLSGLPGNPIDRLKSRFSRKALLAQQVNLVRQSALFDANWYLETYPDVAEAKIDPALHYISEGWREGRNPGPEFSSNGYLKANRDVAAASLNPFLHYLEHGMAEGRVAGDLGPALARRTSQDFGPPAPVFEYPQSPMSVVRWLRHYELDERPGERLRIGDQVVGHVPDEGVAAVNEPLAQFWRLSGVAGDCPAIKSSGSVAPNPMIPSWADGWLLGNRMLRTRWALGSEDAPIVVRGYQRSGRGRAPQLVGEALVTTALDVADFTLANPLFPVLFFFCRPDGEVVGAIHLAFPSLCRGGLHYAELLSKQGPGGCRAISVGEHYAQGLEAIVSGTGIATLQSVRVDLAGADGTRPMFGVHVQDWLDLIMHVDIDEAIAPVHAKSTAVRFLGDRVAGNATRHAVRLSAKAQLTLPSDAIPTIAVLVNRGEKAEETSGDIFGSLLIAQADPTKPTLVVNLPPTATLPVAQQSSAFALAFPRLSNGHFMSAHGHAAIRSIGDRPLAESEILQPIAQPLAVLAPPARTRPLVVAIEPQLWDVAALEAGMRALGLQRGSDEVRLVLIGSVDTERMAIATAAFGDRVKSRPDNHAFIEALEEEDVLHLGPNVLLHDDRTIVTLQSLLDDAASASCPIVKCAKRGKGWTVAVSDAGLASAVTNSVEPLRLAPYFSAFFRSVTPVHAQPRDLWAARADVLRNAPEEAQGAHLCCALVTASYFDGSSEQTPTLDLPVARAGMALTVGVLVG